MSAAADFNTDDEWQKLVMRWQAAGHEVLYDKGTFRHKAYKKDLDPDTVIKSEGVPFMMSNGHTLTFKDLIPERADLCLDMDGNMLPQHEFEKRYREYLNWFSYVEGSDPGAEHIPSAERWITQTPDTFSESPGTVDIGFDARKPAEEEATHKYDPVNDKLVEIVQATSEKTDLAIEALSKFVAQSEASDEPEKVKRPKAGKGAKS